MAFAPVLTTKATKVLADLRRDQGKHRKVVRCLAKLEESPGHPGLSSHRYEQVKGALGESIWESYVENHAPAAWRVWWCYGPGDGEITVVDIGPHP